MTGTTGGYFINGFPLNVYLGGELNFYMGRLQVVPMAAAGLGMLIPKEENADFELSHAGFMLQASVNLLVANQLRVFVEGGYAYWAGLGDYNENYGGIFAGAGLMIKY
jgi:hypothetical protein